MHNGTKNIDSKTKTIITYLSIITSINGLNSLNENIHLA